MSSDEIKAVLDRVLIWPTKRREDAARMLMESRDEINYRLT